jgi:hypothetical protein
MIGCCADQERTQFSLQAIDLLGIGSGNQLLAKLTQSVRPCWIITRREV